MRPVDHTTSMRSLDAGGQVRSHPLAHPCRPLRMQAGQRLLVRLIAEASVEMQAAADTLGIARQVLIRQLTDPDHRLAFADLVLLDELLGGRLLAELAAARGMRVLPLLAPAEEAAGALAAVGVAAGAAGGFIASAAEALADGVVLPGEQARVERTGGEAQSAIGRAVAAVSTVAAAGRR